MWRRVLHRKNCLYLQNKSLNNINHPHQEEQKSMERQQERNRSHRAKPCVRWMVGKILKPPPMNAVPLQEEMFHLGKPLVQEILQTMEFLELKRGWRNSTPETGSGAAPVLVTNHLCTQLKHTILLSCGELKIHLHTSIVCSPTSSLVADPYRYPVSKGLRWT